MTLTPSETFRNLLGDDQTTMDVYTDILRRFSSNETLSDAAFKELASNPAISKAMTSLFSSGLSDVSCLSIISSIWAILEQIGDSDYFTTLFWFAIQELIPLSYFEDKVKQWRTVFSPKQATDCLLHIKQLNGTAIRRARLALIDQLMRTGPAFSLNSKFLASTELQLYVIARFQLTESDRLRSFVRCMSLYASRMVSTAQAISWLGAIDATVAAQFGRLSCVNELSPWCVVQEVREYLWILGDDLIEIVRTMPAMNGNTMFESACGALNGNVRLKQYLTKLPEMIHELRAVKACHCMKDLVKGIRAGSSDFTKIRPTIGVLCGQLSESPEPGEIMYVLGSLVETGRIAQAAFKKYLHSKQDQLEVASHDWRNLYWRRFRRQSIIRDITMGGLLCKFPGVDVLDTVNSFLVLVLERFSDLIPKFSEFVEIFIGGSRFCTCDGAAAIAYYLEIVNISLHSEFRQDIATAIFEEARPVGGITESVVGHIDVPVLNFAKMLRRMGDGHFTVNLAQVLLSDDEFVFLVDVTTEGIFVRPLANPTASRAS